MARSVRASAWVLFAWHLHGRRFGGICRGGVDRGRVGRMEGVAELSRVVHARSK